MPPHPLFSIELPHYAHDVPPPDNLGLHPSLQRACRHEETDIVREEKEGKFKNRSQENPKTIIQLYTHSLAHTYIVQ